MKLFYKIFLVLFVMILSSCSYIQIFNKSEPTIYAFIQSTEMYYWQQVAQGMEHAITEKMADLIITELNSEKDMEGQLKLIQKAISKRPDVLIVTPIMGLDLQPLLVKAQKRKIPVIVLEEAIPSDIPRTLIFSDNDTASSMAADEMIEALQGKGKIIILNTGHEQPKALNKEQSFKKTIMGYPDIEILNTFYCNGDPVITERTVKDILAAYPDLDGFFAACPKTASGVAAALNNINKTGDIIVIGYNQTADTTNLIKRGELLCSIVQDSYRMGYMAIDTAFDIIGGREIAARIDVGFVVLSQDSLNRSES